MNVVLTPEQTEALGRGEEVILTLDDTEYVLMRRDVRAKIRSEYDDSELSPGETYEAVERVLDQEPDPGLDSYQIYK
jgi:hypothetical protein